MAAGRHDRQGVFDEVAEDPLDCRPIGDKGDSRIRVGPEIEGAELHDVSYVAASYGLANRQLGAVGLLGPLRMDYETAIRSVRTAAFEISRLVQDVYEEA